MVGASTSDRTEAGSNQTVPAPAWETSTSSIPVEKVRALLLEIKAELKTAGDFGKFEEHEFNQDAPYPEIVAVNIMKTVAEKYGIKL